MFTLHPYLIFHGQAQKALDLYTEALGLTIGMQQTYASSGQEHTPDQSQWIMHAELCQGDHCIAMICDQPQHQKTQFIPVQLSLNYTDLRQMQRAFDRLSAGGQVTMPLAKQFWGAHFGMLTDRFGIPWMMNCDLPEEN